MYHFEGQNFLYDVDKELNDEIKNINNIYEDGQVFLSS